MTSQVSWYRSGFEHIFIFQLDTVLSKTDHMLSMVKDLFGDDAKVRDY